MNDAKSTTLEIVTLTSASAHVVNLKRPPLATILRHEVAQVVVRDAVGCAHSSRVLAVVALVRRTHTTRLTGSVVTNLSALALNF